MLRGFWIVLLIVVLAGCVPTNLETKVTEISKTLPPGETLAVGLIYERETGDVSALGDLLRDRVEGYFRQRGVTIKARRDVGFIIDDLESFGPGTDEGEIWQQAGADLLALGSYARQTDSDGQPVALLTIKVVRPAESTVVDSRELIEKLDANWARLAAQVKGNVYQEEVEVIVDDSTTAGPPLAARLDRSPGCYPSGSAGRVIIDTAPGSHLYLLNLAADRSVTLLYPNSVMSDQPLPMGHFEFPPRALEDDVQLAFYPLDEHTTIQEGIKVVASRYPLDFSFLPVPENTIFAGAQGGKIKQVVEVLNQNFGWSEKLLSYYVGPGCQ